MEMIIVESLLIMQRNGDSTKYIERFCRIMSVTNSCGLMKMKPASKARFIHMLN